MKNVFFLFFLFVVFFAKSSFALVEIDITRGNLNPLPIAVSPLYVESKSSEVLKELEVGSEIAKIIETNLSRSGLFSPLEKDSFVQKPDIAHLKPRFEDWKLIKAQALITGKVNITSEKLRIEFRLWDVLAAKEIMALAFTTVPDNWRRVAHIITDKIYKRLTGEDGYFDTRIIYVAEKGPKNQRIKKLAIMDQDGKNTKYLTLGNELVLTPRFNPTNQMVTYMSYFRNLPRVYLLDIETGVQEVVGEFPGMTFAPRFSPDGKKIIMSFAKDGNSDIFTMNLETRVVERITEHPAIDTSPSYSPDGKYICFNSDRSGYQQIYVMRSDGSDVKRITFGQGIYG
ncbi:MAG TPA: Tol-Pal system beta propeller repeat protein TolB, partial [Pelagibacteraceae bacterium]|nr:Tol-Pal system beta propeller repeat protein TolB [Pelagibacteraceae bacterium]